MNSNVEMERRIHGIGRSLVRCTNSCVGITNDRLSGILPRCLYFERDGRSESDGCVMVGLNPGGSDEKEQEYFKRYGTTYSAWLEFWNKNNHRFPYHTKLRKMADQLELYGPILWTELAKCESSDNCLPPLQTFRVCAGLYLRKELEVIPEEWPIFAVGKETYKALLYLFPTRAVIGVPHPTGSWGNFQRLFEKNSGRLLKPVQALVNSAQTASEAVWLKETP